MIENQQLLTRYSQSLVMPEIGIIGQEKICQARIVIIGAGGLGCCAALYLASSGVNAIGIVDHDQVDLSNLQRQIAYDQDVIGNNKAIALANKIKKN